MADAASQGVILNPATAGDSQLRQWLDRRWTELDSDYDPWRAVHREIAQWVAPQRASFLLSDRTPQDALLNPDILDDTAPFAGETASAGLTSGMMSSWRPWFLLTTPYPRQNETPAARTWLHRTTERLHWVALMTNLYTEAPTLFLDQVHFGTSPMLSFEDDDRFLRFEIGVVGSYRLAQDADRRVHTYFREMWLTVEQVVEKFGRDNVSSQVVGHYDGGGRSKGLLVRHAILRNPRHDPRRAALPQFRPWADIYWEVNAPINMAPTWLRYDGYHEFPVFAARWSLRAGEVYGVGPGFQALPNIKSVNAMEGDGMDAVAKYVDPPMTGPASLRNEPVSLLPAGLTIVDETKGQGKFQPAYAQTIDLRALDDRLDRKRDAIRRCYREDLFRLMIELERGNVRQAEIFERRDERVSLLAPVFERDSVDVFTPLVERLYAVADRRGLIDPPPPELDGVPLRVKYQSVMAVQLAAVASRGITQFGQEVLSLIGSLGPQLGRAVADKVNWDRFVDRLAEMRGVPPEIIVSDMALNQARAARAQQERAAMALQAAASAAKTTRDLSGADLSGDSVLSRLATPAAS